MQYILDDFMRNGDVDSEREEDTERAASIQESERKQQEAINHQRNLTDYTT